MDKPRKRHRSYYNAKIKREREIKDGLWGKPVEYWQELRAKREAAEKQEEAKQRELGHIKIKGENELC